MLSPDLVRRISAQSGCARSTLIAYFSNPLRVREASRLRIERAISELGLADRLPAPLPLAVTSADPLLGIASGGKLIA